MDPDDAFPTQEPVVSRTGDGGLDGRVVAQLHRAVLRGDELLSRRHLRLLVHARCALPGQVEQNFFATTWVRASAISSAANSVPNIFCQAVKAASSSSPWRSYASRAHWA